MDNEANLNFSGRGGGGGGEGESHQKLLSVGRVWMFSRSDPGSGLNQYGNQM